MTNSEIFNNKPFQQVTREERHFCFLLGHSLLSSPLARQAFVSLVGEKNVSLDADNLQVFVEVAALRDYWRDLGNPRKYCDKTRRARVRVLRALLAHQGLPVDKLMELGFLRSTGREPKLHSPGRWSLKLMDKELNEVFVDDQKRAEVRSLLCALKWAFNAKPDFLMISGNRALMIEAKVESGIGTYGRNGENQVQTQALISELLMKYVPSFHEVEISHLTLGKGASGTRKSTFDLTWDQISKCVDKPGVDNFTRSSLAGLAST